MTRNRALRLLTMGLTAVLALACDDSSSEGDDCRQAQAACAVGFVCMPGANGGAWQCAPERIRFEVDAEPPPGDSEVEDAAPTDAGTADMPTRPDALVESEPQAAPGGPCDEDLPCLTGDCLDDHPGGFCEVPCEDDEECGATARCVAGVCLTDCSDLGCRAGWVCAPDEAVCRAHCAEVPCDDMFICDEQTGLCEPPPMCSDEVCDGKDDDCDGLIDEGLLNACGECGDLPEEVCDTDDNDCDGEVDEGVINACGACGAVPNEVCDDADNDCDGEVDEGLINACGECGPLPVDTCDGVDDDCDGAVDEQPECEDGRECVDGECQRRSGPGGPCLAEAECGVGECIIDPVLPGGLCGVECAVDDDCGPNAICEINNGLCIEWCDDECRAGWVCYRDEGFCWPSCDFIGCNDGYVCGNEGFCEVPLVTVTVSTIFILPGKWTGDAWDGVGTVPQEILSGAARLAGLGIFADLAGFFGQLAIGAFDPPDPYGTATLLAGGQFDIRLPEVQDDFTPNWVIQWNGLPLDPQADIRLAISLTDADLFNDDGIGRVEVGIDVIQAALAAGDQIVVDTSDQGAGHIVAFSLSVRRE